MPPGPKKLEIRFGEGDAQVHTLHICSLAVVLFLFVSPVVILLGALWSGEFTDWLSFAVSLCVWLYFFLCFDLRKIEGPSNPDDDFLRLTGQSYSRIHHVRRIAIYAMLYVIAFASILRMLFSTMPDRYFRNHRREMYRTVNSTLMLLFASGMIPSFECRYFCYLYDCGGAWISQGLVKRTGRVTSLATPWMVLILEAVSQSFLSLVRHVNATTQLIKAHLKGCLRQIARSSSAIFIKCGNSRGCPIQLNAPYQIKRRGQYLPAMAARAIPSEFSAVA